jgi:hypothetical protein
MLIQPEGFALGCMIGVITSTNFILVIRPALVGTSQWKLTKAVGAQILAIPGFWGGGIWVTTGIFNVLDWSAIHESYFLGIAVIFGPLGYLACLVVLWLLLREVASKH